MNRTQYLPDGKRSAACFTFDCDAEEVWIVDERAERRPGVRSQGTYGPQVAVPLILDCLKRHDVTATFFFPGKVAERHPHAVEAILAAGHEIGHHGYTHRAPSSFSVSEEERELEAGLNALTKFGVEPLGYRAPSWDISEATIALIDRYGFQYSSNLMDDFHPYVHPDRALVELPVHWLLDDAAHFWFSNGTFTRTIRTVAEAEAAITEETRAIAEYGGLANLTFHPQITGRPSRMALLEHLLSAATEDPAVWVASAGEIARQVARSATSNVQAS